jgi:recombination protein RecA
MGQNAEDVIKIINAKKPKGAIIELGDSKKLRKERLPFGIDALDAITTGGLSYGRHALIYGEGSVGKTFIMYKLIANAQKLGKHILYICIDKTYEQDWAATVGVDISDLAVLIPKYGEQAWEMAHAALEGDVDLVILDSIDALVPVMVAERSMDEMSFGAEQAKLNATGFRKAQMLNNNSVLVCLNHVREGMGKWASKSLPGGVVQEDFSSMMIYVQRGAALKDDTKKIGFTMRLTVEKDKVGGHQYDSCELPFIYEGGIIDTVGGLMTLCIENGIIPGVKGHYQLFEESIFGKEKLRDYLTNNPEVQDKLRVLLKKSK